MDLFLIVLIASTLTLPAVFWCLFLESFTFESARRGYQAIGAAVAILSVILGVGIGETDMIPWFMCGLLSAAFGRWGLPLLKYFFSGKADERLNSLFRN